MIVYKCDMCGKIHEEISKMTDILFSHVGKSMVNYTRDGKFQVCKDCENKLLKTLNAWGASEEVKHDQSEISQKL